MLSWQIGKVKITRLVESENIVPHEGREGFLPAATPDALAEIPWLRPHFVDGEGRLVTAIQAILVETPEYRMVVDTCIGLERPTDKMEVALDATPFLKGLEAAGWTRESVDFVLCTHLHFDHVGWNTFWCDERWVPTFPKARYLFSRAEYDHWSHIDAANIPEMLAGSVRPVMEAGLADMVALDHRISEEVRLMPTLGHTPGHVSIVIESEGETAIVTGDMAHHPCQFAHPDWSTLFDSDTAQAIATRRDNFASWADQPVLVIGTHFPAPTAGLVKSDGDAYRFQTASHVP